LKNSDTDPYKRVLSPSAHDLSLELFYTDLLKKISEALKRVFLWPPLKPALPILPLPAGKGQNLALEIIIRECLLRSQGVFR